MLVEKLLNLLKLPEVKDTRKKPSGSSVHDRPSNVVFHYKDIGHKTIIINRAHHDTLAFVDLEKLCKGIVKPNDDSG